MLQTQERPFLTWERSKLAWRKWWKTWGTQLATERYGNCHGFLGGHQIEHGSNAE